jgi:hypothetical protein
LATLSGRGVGSGRPVRPVRILLLRPSSEPIVAEKGQPIKAAAQYLNK